MDAGFTSALLSRAGELLALWPGARLHRFGGGILVLEIPLYSKGASTLGAGESPGGERLLPSAQR
jgi:hypothetical protein